MDKNRIQVGDLVAAQSPTPLRGTVIQITKRPGHKEQVRVRWTEMAGTPISAFENWVFREHLIKVKESSNG